ncbi:MAG: helix-turn-helix transcriptional regulator [Spirochaetales bacterium]|nr:helix-turn-helix transcriptional regulator [Spirochaetales bacterium]
MENLKQIRKSLRLSQMDLAQKVGVSLVTIQLWEREISKPTEKNKKELERVIAELQQQQKGDR